MVLGRDLAEHGRPADEVVGQRGADEPGRVGEELSRGQVLEARTFFEVPDGELDVGVGAVEGVDVDGVTLEVGHEGEVAPLGPQRGLAPDQSGAAHDEPASLVGGLGHLGLTIGGCSRSGSRRLVDGRDGADHGFGIWTPMV